MCPFEVGETVLYTPSPRTRSLVPDDDHARLQPGGRYRVADIEDDSYLVLEGFTSSTGKGLHWRNFSAVPPGV